MEKPLVTIMVPTFNDAGTVARCLQSAVDQDYGNLRVAALDNHSSDATYDLLLDFEKRYRDRVYTGRIFTHVSTNDHRNRCTGLINPRSKYIHYLDPANTISPSFITRTVELFESNENIGCVLTQADLLEPSGELRPARRLRPEGGVIPGDAMMEALMGTGLDLDVDQAYRLEIYLLARSEGLIFNRFPTWLPMVMASSIADFGYVPEPLAHQGGTKALLGPRFIPSLEDYFEHYLFLQSFSTIANRLNRSDVVRHLPSAVQRLSADCVRCSQVLLEKGDPKAARSYLSLSLAFLPETSGTPDYQETLARLA